MDSFSKPIGFPPASYRHWVESDATPHRNCRVHPGTICHAYSQAREAAVVDFEQVPRTTRKADYQALCGIGVGIMQG